MRTARLQAQLGVRLAVGLLAAVYLWNLKIVCNILIQGEGDWNPIFPAAHPAPLPKGASHESTRKDPTMDHSLKIVVPNSKNNTLPLPEHRVPGFIIIGAQKSATQALRSYMLQHPLVHFPTSVIEPHFFDWAYDKKKSSRKNLDAYIKLLNGKHGDCRQLGCVAGESTPSYLFDTRHVPARIKKVCPWVKFIVVLRDPVKRAFSQCNMLIEKHEVKTSFYEHFQFDLNWMKKVGLVSNYSLTIDEEADAWNKYHSHHRVRKMMLGRGLYEIQLRQWFRYFPRDQFLILKSEELDFNRTATMKRVFQFIGLHDHKLDKAKKVHTKHYTSTMTIETSKALYDFYRPYNQRLERLLGPEWKDIWEEPSRK